MNTFQANILVRRQPGCHGIDEWTLKAENDIEFFGAMCRIAKKIRNRGLSFYVFLIRNGEHVETLQ